MIVLLSGEQIRDYLRSHQRRLRAGDELPCMTDIAKRAGVHRDTLYALLKGEHINIRSQYALSKAVNQLHSELVNKQKTKLMNVSLSPQGARLGFGVQATPMFRSR
jgi:DNA-binding transcriptional regulator YhcF (GntR family)